MQRVFLVAALALSGCIHQYERVPLPNQPGADPSAQQQPPPPGMVQVDVISTFDEQSWDVYAGDVHLCTTPCSQWLDPMQSLRLEARGTPRDWIRVPALGVEALESGSAVVVATGSHRGKYVNGIVFTTLGGMGVVVGITFTAVGCSDLERRGGLCTAGLITGGASLPLTAFALWMLIDSAPHAEVFPVHQIQPAPGQPPVTIRLGPAGVSGTF
jgi:hypothetical protein